MPRPDKPTSARPPSPEIRDIAAVGTTPVLTPPSKTRRKADMHEKQALGEALMRLDADRLKAIASELALPERLIEAIQAVRGIKSREGRRRQIQFVGRLMREIETDGLSQRMDALSAGRHRDIARQHALERWRDRLLAEPDALAALAAEYPALDRPRFRALIARAQEEQARELSPHARRALFRELEALAPGPRGAAERETPGG